MNPTQAVLRRPLQDFSFYQEMLKEFNFETAKELFNHTTIKNAIHLASPDMFEALDKMFYNHKEDKIVLLSFYKYLLRMSSRCTPFGLFAGCGVVHLEASESVSSFNFYTQSSLDNSLLAVLIHEIKKSNLEKLAYKVNPTVFLFYGYFRFIRSSFNDKNHKSYSIFAIKSSGLLQKIIKKVKKFTSFQELVALIASDASEQEEAKNYLLQLIACEFLITNFEISLTTAKDLLRLATIMQENKMENNEKLLNIQEKIEELDQNWHQKEFDFKGFNQLLNIENQEIKNKIQTDLFFKPTPFGFPKKHHKELQETIHFLQNINTTTSYNDSFTVFRAG
jgi:lantibiotic biosynthesis protein